MKQIRGQNPEIAFEGISVIAAQTLQLDKQYQTDMQFAKNQMLLSLAMLKRDDQFLKEMDANGVNYASFDDNKLTDIRDDIWQRYIKILDTAYYLTSTNVLSQICDNKEPILYQCKVEFKKLIDYLILQKYIPPVNLENYGYAFWSSRLGQNEALEYSNSKNNGNIYINDVIVSRYYARLLTGWRTDDIQRVTNNTEKVLNVTYVMLRHDKPKLGYEALSMFYWQAHSRAYAAFITPQSKVKLIIQDGLQEDNFFFNAELPILREKGVTIDLVFLKRYLAGTLIRFDFIHDGKLYKISHPITSVRHFKKSLLISTMDNSIIQIAKNKTSTPHEYGLSIIRIGTQLIHTIPAGCRFHKVYLSKQKILEAIQTNYNAAWVNMGSLDTLPLTDLLIRRIEDHYVRSNIKIRGYLVDQLLLKNTSSKISLTNQLATTPFNEYCVYTTCNSAKSSVWKMAYERSFCNQVNIVEHILNEKQLDDWVALHKKDDVLYYRSIEFNNGNRILWKKLTIINDELGVEINKLPKSILMDIYSSLIPANGPALAIKLRHNHNITKRKQLFGAEFFIKESIRNGESIYQMINKLDSQFKHLIQELRTSQFKDEILAYIQYDIGYQLNQQCFKFLTHNELTKLISNLTGNAHLLIQPSLLTILQNKYTRLRANFYLRRSSLTLAPQYWPESYSISALTHLRDEDGDRVAIYRDRYFKLKTYIQEKMNVSQQSFQDILNQINIKTIMNEIGVHLIKYIMPEHLYQYEIDYQAFRQTGELQSVAGVKLDTTQQNLIALFNGKIYIHRKIIPTSQTIGISHSSFSQGKPVESTASLLFENGHWVLENTSGHYEPRITHLGNILRALISYGFPQDIFTIRGKIPHICPTLLNKRHNPDFTNISVPMTIFQKKDIQMFISDAKAKKNISAHALVGFRDSLFQSGMAKDSQCKSYSKDFLK